MSQTSAFRTINMPLPFIGPRLDILSFRYPS